MLERYSLTTSPEQLKERFPEVVITDHYSPRFNAAPSQLLPVITNDSPDGFSFFYWGTVPKWSRNKTISRKLINAEKEELNQKPSYKRALKSHRCLIPADGFYAWKSVGRKSRIPYRIILNNGAPFCIAGLWEEYQDESDTEVHTFSMITIPSNDLIFPVIPKMPAILPSSREKEWLNTHMSIDNLLDLLSPVPAEQMGLYTVSPMIDSNQLDLPSMVNPAPAVDQFGNFTLFN